MSCLISKITKILFSKMDTLGVHYCIYNGYETLPKFVENDIDIAIEERVLGSLDDILFEICRSQNLFLLHKIWHGDKKISYVLSPTQLTNPERLQLDFFSEFSTRDFKRKNSFLRYHFMDERTLLEECQRKSYFYIPPPHREFIVKLLRRVIKEDLNEKKYSKILRLYGESPERSLQELRKYFINYSSEIQKALEENDVQYLASLIPELKEELKRFKKRFYNVSALLNTTKRAIYRVKYPVGMMVAFLGTDGSGKSTIARKIMGVLARSFHGERLFYWRPELFKQPGVMLGLREEITMGVNPDPHGHKPENPLKSYFRFLYYLSDFILGYAVKVWPLKIKKNLCIFDRYYYDVLVDKFRYNFSLPLWLLKLPLPFIPKPDVTIILDLPVEELLKRKQELPREELERQRKEFLTLASKIPNAYIVDNSRPLDEVIREITSIILLNKSYQTYFSLNLKQEEDDEEYVKKLKKQFNIKKIAAKGQQLIAIPRASSPRVFFAADSYEQFKASMDLYTPSRPFVKFIYKNIPPILLYFALKKLSSRKFYIENSGLMEKIKNIFPGSKSGAIYAGAPGPHRKPLVQIIGRKGDVLGYVKLAMNNRTRILLEREEEAVNFIKSLELDSVEIPNIIDKGELTEGIYYIAFNAVRKPFKKSYKITDAHIKFLNEMFSKTGREEIFKKTEFYESLMKRIEFLEGKIPYYWMLRYRRILDYYKDKVIPICYSHGDFTPWNAFVDSDNKLLLFDWEYSRQNVAFADLFYFIVQISAFSSKKVKNIKNVVDRISQEIAYYTRTIDIIKTYVSSWKDLFLIYLLEVSSLYFIRNLEAAFVEKDLRLEIMWSNLVDFFLPRIGT